MDYLEPGNNSYSVDRRVGDWLRETPNDRFKFQVEVGAGKFSVAVISDRQPDHGQTNHYVGNRESHNSSQ